MLNQIWENNPVHLVILWFILNNATVSIQLDLENKI